MSRGDGSVFKRGSTYWMKFYRDGRPVSMSCKTTSKDIAKTKLRAEIRKSDEEFTEPRFKRVTVEELYKQLIEYYEIRGNTERVKRAKSKWDTYFVEDFGHLKALQVNSEVLNRHQAKRTKAGAAPGTLNTETAFLYMAFKLGYEQEPPLVKRMPKFKFLPVDNARKVFATLPQVSAIKEAAAKHSLAMRTFVEIIHLFGWRSGEAHKLKVSNIHLDTSTIRLETSKNGEAREVPTPTSLRVLLEALIVGREQHEPVFNFSRIELYRRWWEIVEAAGCPEIHMHDFRRTSARSKRAAGIDPSVIMAIQGWKTDAMFRRYGIVDTDDKAVALQREADHRIQLQNGYSPALTN